MMKHRNSFCNNSVSLFVKYALEMNRKFLNCYVCKKKKKKRQELFPMVGYVRIKEVIKLISQTISSVY